MKLAGCVLLGAALAVLAACGAGGPAPAVGTPRAASSSPSTGAQFTPSADGVRIAWQQHGQGEPAVVLIPGWAADSSIWQEQLAALAPHCTVITLDLAGEGASGANRQNWTLSNFAQDVAAVVAKLPNAHIVLVGDGMGGPVALEAAPLIGARVTGIIGIETFRTVGLGPPLSTQVDVYLKDFAKDFPGAVHQYVSGSLFHPQTDPALVQRVADLMAQTPQERALAALADLNKLDYAAILPAVKAPIVVIDSDLGGAVDTGRPQHSVAQLQVITLGGDDSFPMLDDAQRFNTTLLQAIASLEALSVHSEHP